MRFESKRQQAMVMLGMMAGFMNLFPNGAPPEAREVLTDELVSAMEQFGREVLVGADEAKEVDPQEFALLMVAVFEAENDESSDLPRSY